MKTTQHFEKLSKETRDLIVMASENRKAQDQAVVQKLNIEENRSRIYELIGKNIILKVLLPKGTRDEDINALIDLDGIEYFPKLYAYEEGKYLFMEKAQGVSLPDFIRLAEDNELDNIKRLLLDALGKMIDRKRYDWDFKLEHIFWSRENKKLTWIDFSICETYSTPYPSKKEVLEEFEQYFKKELRFYGRKI